MTNQDPTDSTEPGGRDRKSIALIVLGVVVVVLAGAIIGYVVSGGLSEEAAPTSTLVATTVTSLPPTSAAAPSTTEAETSPTTIESSTTIASAPPISDPEGQLTLRATRDTFIDVDEPTETNGDEAVLEVENDPPETKQALIGFDVTGLSEGVVINEAIMRLTLVTPHETPISVHDVIGEWSEAATSASNAPLLGDLITMIDPPEPGDVFVEADVTDAITGDGPVSFYLIPGTEIVEGDFAARESASGVPILILRWDP